MSHRLVLAALAGAALFAGCSKQDEVPAAAEPVAAPEPQAAAPAQSVNAHGFRIGDLSATSLLDGNLELPNDSQVFGVGLKPEDVAAVLTANELPTDTLKLSVHPLLVKSGDRLLLFDTGAGGTFGPGSGHLLHSMSEAGIDPAGITDIFISHSHGDHVGGLANAQGALNFPNATVHLSRPEWAAMQGNAQLAAIVSAIQPKVKAFAPGAELLPGVVTAVEVKGHTPGHSAYRISSGTESLLYVGDSMHHYVVSVQKPEWTIAFDGDKPIATASRVALIRELTQSGQRVFAVHFPFPGVGKIVQKGEGAAWAPE
jgi:glyoxylase-like metal-dependent hydrolase (beta-lactamase superfamily II)